MLEDVENAELDRLLVLLAEPFHVLTNLDLRLLVHQLRVRRGVGTKFRVGDFEALKQN